MTKEQSDQFNSLGCAARCLFWFANLRGERRRTATEFIDELTPFYPEWTTHCGGTNTGTIFDLAKRLSLATHFQVYRSPDLVRGHTARNETNTILLVTEYRPPKINESQWQPYMHCRVVGRQLDKGWHVEEVDSALATCNPLTILDSDFEQWGACFYVFFLGIAPTLIHGN